ncbi:hypothetical protein Lesp02_74800 [Lentzea sp. NBRC 105346]|uniref:RNA polymerase sigma factor n=1 Tax=Lentzea sp. NBRC 105346 TaxID=3032205 RepID=UPI0024A07918|nr:sigma factor [Lentzea sp. NBRC 105346]GLZ35293.1 hypothetical protein Lesp02_74800 [Lentzea sp. NBRC 105346]
MRQLRGLSRHDAEDVVSETFVALYRRRSALRAAEVPEAFAFKVLGDALKDFWRRRIRHPSLVGEIEDRPVPDEVAGVVARLDFQRLLSGLPDRQAECLALYALLE